MRRNSVLDGRLLLGLRLNSGIGLGEHGGWYWPMLLQGQDWWSRNPSSEMRVTLQDSQTGTGIHFSG
ncbi:hypothetical protein LIA77_11548 [Sarocladium implicatum]|nr:hypothetical protein LIA77_11548 [Sarocladium implicatum]